MTTSSGARRHAKVGTHGAAASNTGSSAAAAPQAQEAAAEQDGHVSPLSWRSPPRDFEPDNPNRSMRWHHSRVLRERYADRSRSSRGPSAGDSVTQLPQSPRSRSAYGGSGPSVPSTLPYQDAPVPGTSSGESGEPAPSTSSGASTIPYPSSLGQSNTGATRKPRVCRRDWEEDEEEEESVGVCMVPVGLPISHGPCQAQA